MNNNKCVLFKIILSIDYIIKIIALLTFHK